MDRGICIVNVSYNIAAAEEDGFLSRACRKAYERGAIMVASYRTGKLGRCIPRHFRPSLECVIEAI